MFKPRPAWSRISGVLVSIVLATSQASPTIAFAATSVDKAETVHVQLDGSGQVSSIRVEDLLANDGDAQQIADRSTLADITAGDEKQTFAQGSNDALTWTTNGNAVSYEGMSEADPPVKMTLTYTLDGKQVNPNALAGATGHLVIHIAFENGSVSQTPSGTVKTPFVCLTAAMLDSDVFSNVKVTNGRVIDDKGGLAVIGYAMPGLKESLDLDEGELDLDLPEFVELEADVNDLVMDPIYTIVTPELFTDLDTDDLDLGLDDLDEGTDALRDAMGLLIEGSDTLTSGLGQLADGSGQLRDGASALKEALGMLPSGVSALTEGLGNLSDGLSAASGYATQLSNGAAELSEAASGASTYASSASGSINDATDAVKSLKSEVDKLDLRHDKELIEQSGEKARAAHDAAADAKSAIEGAANMASQDLATKSETATAAVDQALEALTSIPEEDRTEEQKQAITKLQEAREGLQGVSLPIDTTSLDADITTLDEAATTLGANADSLDTDAKGVDAVTSGADTALEKLASAKNAIDTAAGIASGVAEGSNALSTQLDTFAQQVSGASAGAETLAKSVAPLSENLPQLVSGMDGLAGGADALTTGLSAAASGSGQLTEGLKAFDSKGIAELIAALNELDDGMGDVSDKIDSLRKAADEYDTFAGKAEDQTGTVRFIYKTPAIG